MIAIVTSHATKKIKLMGKRPNIGHILPYIVHTLFDMECGWRFLIKR